MFVAIWRTACVSNPHSLTQITEGSIWQEISIILRQLRLVQIFFFLIQDTRATWQQTFGTSRLFWSKVDYVVECKWGEIINWPLLRYAEHCTGCRHDSKAAVSESYLRVIRIFEKKWVRHGFWMWIRSMKCDDVVAVASYYMQTPQLQGTGIQGAVRGQWFRQT